MGMSEFYGERNDTESAATILRALDPGLNFLDTADEVFLATKFANVRTKENPNQWSISGTPEYV